MGDTLLNTARRVAVAQMKFIRNGDMAHRVVHTVLAVTHAPIQGTLLVASHVVSPALAEMMAVSTELAAEDPESYGFRASARVLMAHGFSGHHDKVTARRERLAAEASELVEEFQGDVRRWVAVFGSVG